MKLKGFFKPTKWKLLLGLVILFVIPVPQSNAVCNSFLVTGKSPCTVVTEWGLFSVPKMINNLMERFDKYTATQRINIGMNSEWYGKFFVKIIAAITASYLSACLIVYLYNNLYNKKRKK